MTEAQLDERVSTTGRDPSDAAGSRRSFLIRSATTAIVPGLVLGVPTASRAGSGKSKGKPSPPPRRPVSPQPGLNQALIHEIESDEAARVPILPEKLDDTDNPLNPKICPMPVLNMANLVQPNLKAFLETAAGFENTGSGTYGGALFAIQQTDEYFRTAVGLCTVESRHASFLNALLGEALVPDFAPVEAPIEQGITLSRVAPFVLDPVAGLPSFDPLNASDDNNFAILDFLLFLEYIEAASYRLNVPRFFRRWKLGSGPEGPRGSIRSCSAPGC